jgi:hypothetical protein
LCSAAFCKGHQRMNQRALATKARTSPMLKVNTAARPIQRTFQRADGPSAAGAIYNNKVSKSNARKMISRRASMFSVIVAYQVTSRLKNAVALMRVRR